MGHQPCPPPAVKAWVHFSGGGELTSYRAVELSPGPVESGRDHGALVYLCRLTGRGSVGCCVINMHRCEQAGGACQVARWPGGRGAGSARTPLSQDTSRGCREGVGAGDAGSAVSQAT